jgi:predicted MFS family arabinose efflux permease
LRSLLALIRTNRNFRFLWFGQVVSQLGDWFNTVAIFALLFELTGSATAVAVLMVLQVLPVAIVGPAAGVVVDRFDRRRIMIAADLVRGFAVLGLLLVRTPETVWFAYVVTAVQVSASGFFEPARSSTVPMIVERDRLVAANAISTGTWSAMLAIGASLGGLVAATLGRDAAFIINAASFFLSAVFLWQLRIPARPEHVRASAGFKGLAEGLTYMRTHKDVARIALVKGGWALVGGALLLLTVFGDRVFRIGDSSDAGIGILYGARGIGAMAGSLIVSVLAARQRNLVRMIGPSYLIAGTCYAAIAISPTIWVAALAVIAAHIFGSVLWVSSNVLLQMNVPDEFRGRVFSAELFALAIVQSVVSYLTATALDVFHFSPHVLVAIVGFSLWAPGIHWLLARPARFVPSVNDGT